MLPRHSPTLDETLAPLPPIGLAELTARGELLTRVDRKYLLPAAVAARLVDDLRAHAAALTIDGHRAFAYESLYYDTPGLGCYGQAAHRRRRRVKVRHRRYLTTGGAFLEVKYAGRRGNTVKERQVDFPHVIDSAELTALDRHAAFLLDAVERSATRIAVEQLQPALVTRYRRRTLFLPDSGCRVTLDTDLAWELPDGSGLALDDCVVVETKSAGGPSDADRLLWTAGHRPTRISKYCTGLALLRPELPANRWHPVLRTLRPAVRALDPGHLDTRNAS